MTQNNAKVHVLADETLGGIKREYVEVDRKAEVGEKIVIVEKVDCGDWFGIGEIFSVDRTYPTEDGDVYCDDASSVHNVNGLIHLYEYHVLEPTDIVHIDGGRYELADRKPEVGEKVIIVALDPELAVESDLGKVTTVTELCSEDDVDTDKIGWVKRSEYRVLVPVESAEADEPQPSDPIFAIGNVAQEVAKLKRKVERLETTIERHELVNDRLKDEIDTLHKDNRTLGEELARLKEPAKSESIIESAPFVLVIHEGRGEFDVYQRGKKIENISRLEIEAYSRLSSSIDLEFNDVGERP